MSIAKFLKNPVCAKNDPNADPRKRVFNLHHVLYSTPATSGKIHYEICFIMKIASSFGSKGPLFLRFEFKNVLLIKKETRVFNTSIFL